MNAYAVEYKLDGEYSETKLVDFLARNKEEAYNKAVYEIIPNREGHLPYFARVHSVTYNNGNYKLFK